MVKPTINQLLGKLNQNIKSPMFYMCKDGTKINMHDFINRLSKKVSHAQQYLKFYGNHKEFCPHPSRGCTCGFFDALLDFDLTQ